MNAVMYDKYGREDVLEMRQVEIPEPPANHVLLKIHAVIIIHSNYKLFFLFCHQCLYIATSFYWNEKLNCDYAKYIFGAKQNETIIGVFVCRWLPFA